MSLVAHLSFVIDLCQGIALFQYLLNHRRYQFFSVPKRDMALELVLYGTFNRAAYERYSQLRQVIKMAQRHGV